MTVSLAMQEPEERKFFNFFMSDNKLIVFDEGECSTIPEIDINFMMTEKNRFIDEVKRRHGR